METALTVLTIWLIAGIVVAFGWGALVRAAEPHRARRLRPRAESQGLRSNPGADGPHSDRRAA